MQQNCDHIFASALFLITVFMPHLATVVMQLIATDGVLWSVCLCVTVRLLATFVSPARTAEPIDMLEGADSDGPKKPCISGVKIPTRRAMLGVVQHIEKHWKSVLRALRSKYINNGDSGNAADGCNAVAWLVSRYTVPP